MNGEITLAIYCGVLALCLIWQSKMTLAAREKSQQQKFIAERELPGILTDAINEYLEAQSKNLSFSFGWTMQLSFELKTPPTVEVDGVVDETQDIVYWGQATMQFDGTWCCLANVRGALCVVEVKISPRTDASPTPRLAR